MRSDKDYNEYVEETRRRRGMIIELSVIIERFIDIYIASVFCSRRKRYGIMQYVLSTRFISAESKRQIFMELLEKHERRYFTKHKNMLSKISSVYTQRNLYGHQLLLSNKESVTRFKDNGEITFGVISDKNYIQRHLPLNEFSNLCIKANNCATVIRELLEKKKYLPL